jgi:hypothetical protein
LYYAFGEVLTITGLKHNAFRAYSKSAELTENERQHEIAVIAAREIKQSQRGDFDKFDDEYLNSQKEEAQTFNSAFTEFAKEHPSFKDFAEIKKAFLENYGKNSTISIILLAVFGLLILVLLIFFSRKSIG